MSRAVFGILWAAALALALVLRLTALGARPVHHDEANQAVRFGMLLETGEYRYDPNDHHGPTLYYLTLPAAWLRGQTTLASLDQWTLRVVPSMFGSGLILLLPLLAGGLGRPAVAMGALLIAISPALTYYSRFYIQESVFAFFACGWLIALGRYSQRPGFRWAVASGAFAGLAFATKETSVIVMAAGVLACWLAGASTGLWALFRGRGGAAAREQLSVAPPKRPAHLLAGLAAAAAVAALFYSSFLTNPAGIVESARALAVYASRGVDGGHHTGPWYYYFGLVSYSASGGLVWTEGLVLVLALAGLLVASRGTAGCWARYICLYSVIAAAIFSALPYKTPWNLLPFYVGIVVLAGVGAAGLWRRAGSRVARGLVAVALLAASLQLAAQCWRASVRYPADTRNPYVYAQTSPDFLRLVARVGELSALHADGTAMLVKVIAGPYEQWPLPWYLRRMTRVGYWTRPAEAGRLEDAPVILASEENAAAVEAALGERYVSEFYGLRPEVLMSAFIERTLWERFLAFRAR